MRSTHTFSILPIPKAAWDYIAEAMEEAGYDHMITEDGNGGITVMFDMHGIGVVPTGDRDTFINSGRLSDLLVAVGEEAFRAGYEAAALEVETRGRANSCLPAKIASAWDRYEPSDDIQEMQVGL